MANTLTNLIPTMYAALDVVSRELVGFIPAVTRNSSLERAALNQSILVPITTPGTAAVNTPGVAAPNTGDQTIENTEVKITKSYHIPIRWNGEETRGMQNAGTYDTSLQNQFEQALRSLCNMIELDLASSAAQASRAFGTAGNTPFATAADLQDVAGVRQILDDNGAPQSDLHLIVGSAAMANIRGKQTGLFKVNEAGTSDLLRRGTIGELEGFAMGNSGQIPVTTKGTGASYTSDTAGYAVGATAITLITGTGTVLAGDVVTFAGDTNKYVVAAGVAAPGVITLAKPGLRKALAASAVAMTIGGDFRANLAFTRSAIQLVTRAPAVPVGGDSADDTMMITDSNSGLSFEVAVYRQFLQTVYHVRLAWGWKAIKPEHIAVLLG